MFPGFYTNFWKKLRFLARLKVWGQNIGFLFSWFVAVIILLVVPLVIDRKLVESLVIGQLIMFGATILTGFIWSRYIYREEFKSIGFTPFREDGWKKLLWGIFYGIIAITLGFMICYLTKVIRVDSINYPGDFLISLFIMTLVAVGEEVLTRGYILRQFMKVYGNFTALVLSSAIFMAMHMFNANLTTLAYINLFLAGILLGTAYIATKSLWLPIGLHFSWNFMQGPVFGFSVSGEATGSVVNQHFIPGYDLFSGGAFGFEGSVQSIIIVLLLIFVLCRYHRVKSVCFHQK